MLREMGLLGMRVFSLQTSENIRLIATGKLFNARAVSTFREFLKRGSFLGFSNSAAERGTSGTLESLAHAWLSSDGEP